MLFGGRAARSGLFDTRLGRSNGLRRERPQVEPLVRERCEHRAERLPIHADDRNE